MCIHLNLMIFTKIIRGFIEVMRALRKGQASAFYYGDPLGEMRLVSRVFEM
ncbi:transposase [Escherichia coli]|nr:transposase [Escherichia coli]KZJ23417.1 transposase [Escherichia coli]